MSLPGVAFIDHTADVGIEVEAPTFQQLLHRSALGMLALLRGEDDQAVPTSTSTSTTASTPAPTPAPTPGDGGHRPGADHAAATLEAVPLSIRAPGHARLVAGWLGEILFLHDVRGMDYVSSELDQIGPDIVEGRLLVHAGGIAVREIKGVTYHELDVHRGEAGDWRARVIFDV